MMKWWYGRIIVMCQYGFRKKWCNDFFCFPNGETVKSLYGIMVIWWNCPMVNHFFGIHFHRWRNGEITKKINSTMNCMVIFNCCMGYQLGFIIINFCPEHQLWPPWQVWGRPPVLYLLSAGLTPIISCNFSILFYDEVV